MKRHYLLLFVFAACSLAAQCHPDTPPAPPVAPPAAIAGGIKNGNPTTGCMPPSVASGGGSEITVVMAPTTNLDAPEPSFVCNNVNISVSFPGAYSGDPSKAQYVRVDGIPDPAGGVTSTVFSDHDMPGCIFVPPGDSRDIWVSNPPDPGGNPVTALIIKTFMNTSSYQEVINSPVQWPDVNNLGYMVTTYSDANYHHAQITIQDEDYVAH